MISRFKSDEDEVIIMCNFGVLTTGFDAPKTSAVLIARPTLSIGLYSQMIGRGLRGPNAGGQKNSEIVVVQDLALDEFSDPGQTFFHWEEFW